MSLCSFLARRETCTHTQKPGKRSNKTPAARRVTLLDIGTPDVKHRVFMFEIRDSSGARQHAGLWPISDGMRPLPTKAFEHRSLSPQSEFRGHPMPRAVCVGASLSTGAFLKLCEIESRVCTRTPTAHIYIEYSTSTRTRLRPSRGAPQESLARIVTSLHDCQTW